MAALSYLKGDERRTMPIKINLKSASETRVGFSPKPARRNRPPIVNTAVTHTPTGEPGGHHKKGHKKHHKHSHKNGHKVPKRMLARAKR